MATIKVPGLATRPNKAGLRYYWQPSKYLAAAGWTALALGRDADAAILAARARNADVEAWRAGGAGPAASDVARVGPTLGALIDRYRREYINGLHPRSGLPRLRPSSRGAYETSMKRLDAWAGGELLSAITAPRIIALRDRSLATIGHGQTHALLTHARTLFAFAERAGLIAPRGNPAYRFDLPRRQPRRKVWETADEAAFIAAAHALAMPGMALAMKLAIYTGQRASDLLAMTDAQIRPVAIELAAVRERFGSGETVMGWHFTQAKTSDEHRGVAVTMALAFDAATLAAIDAALAANRARAREGNVAPLRSFVLVDDRTGRPWRQRRFQEAWTAIKHHAASASGNPAMAELVWHDLRRTRVVRLRRQGMAIDKIAAITGHSPQAVGEMLRVYGPVDPQITAAALAEALGG